jgi:tetratricopeptide (TPR) repeat protein
MILYARMPVFRLIWIIALLFFISSCSSMAILTPADKTPVSASKEERLLLDQGEQYFKQGQFQAALQKVQQAYQLNPDNAETLYAIALCYMSLKDYASSLEYSHRAAAYRSDVLPDNYLLMGTAYQRLDDPWNAMRTYRFAVALYPDNAKLQYRLGETYVYLGKPEFAADAFKAAIAAAPGDAASHYQLGMLYYVNRYYTPALLSLTVSLLLEPDDARVSSVRQAIVNLLGSELENKNTDEGDFSAVNAALLRQRVSLLDRSEKPAAFDVVKAQYLTLYTQLDTASIKNQKLSPVMDRYVSFFSKLHQHGQDEVSVYYIFQNKQDAFISDWLQENAGKVKQLEQLVKNSW